MLTKKYGLYALISILTLTTVWQRYQLANSSYCVFDGSQSSVNVATTGIDTLQNTVPAANCTTVIQNITNINNVVASNCTNITCAPCEPQAVDTNKLLRYPLDINVCMPSFPRKNNADYITHAIETYIKAFAPFRANLTIFNSVYNPGTDPHVALEHAMDVFKDHKDHIHVITRDPSVTVLPPRKFTHNDPPERCKWRSKEAQDYCYILNYCHNLDKSKPVLILQDDTEISSLFKHINAILEFTVKPLPSNWFYLSLFDVHQNVHLGQKKHPLALAKIYNPALIDSFVEHALKNYDEDPVDWLQDDFGKDRGYGMFVYVPNIVQHTGAISSFENNAQRGSNEMSKTYRP